MSIPILEETFGIQTAASQELLESIDYLLAQVSLHLARVCSAIVCLSSNVIKDQVHSLLETFLGEYLINGIAEISPSNVFAFFWSLEESD